MSRLRRLRHENTRDHGIVPGGDNVRRFLRALPLAAALVPTSSATWAQGDAAAGRQLAMEWCSNCHNVAADGQMKQDPPSFAAIAMYRSPGYIRSNIVAPHGAMPDIANVLGLNVDDLVAYITSLDRPLD